MLFVLLSLFTSIEFWLKHLKNVADSFSHSLGAFGNQGDTVKAADFDDDDDDLDDDDMIDDR